MRATSRLVCQVSHKISIPTLSAFQSIKLSRSSTFQATHLSKSNSNLQTSPQIRRYSSSCTPHFLFTCEPLKVKRTYSTATTSQKPGRTNNQFAKMARTADLDNLPKERQPIVISGPSGSGKSTMLKMLFEKYPGRFGFSVSREFLLLFSPFLSLCGGGGGG